MREQTDLVELSTARLYFVCVTDPNFQFVWAAENADRTRLGVASSNLRRMW